MAAAEPVQDDVDPTTKRDRRAAEESMAVVREAPDLFEVYSGETSVHTVDLESGACTCEDWQYRSEQIGRCKHASRVLQTLGRIPIERGGDRVDPVLENQRARWSR